MTSLQLVTVKAQNRYKGAMVAGRAMSWIDRLRARFDGNTGIASLAWLAGLVVLSETYHLTATSPTLIASLGWAWLGVLLAYLLAGAVVLVSSVLLFRDRVPPVLPVAAVFYALLSAKVLVIDADFLGTPGQKLGFAAATAALFTITFLAYRRLGTDLVFPIALVGYVNLLKVLRSGWSSRGGNVTAFLTSQQSLTTIATIAALCIVACVLASRVRKRGGRALLAGASCLLPITGIVQHSEVPRATWVDRGAATAHEPDIYVLSFDALRKDVFDQRCSAPASEAWRLVCDRSVRYQNVFAAGLQTPSILKNNLGFSGQCDASLPFRLARRGYATAMFYGARDRTIPGWRCFDHFYSGTGVELYNHFALPSLVSQLGPKAPLLRFKFLETIDLLDALREDQGKVRSPFFAYLHVLDFHAPYLPSSRRDDDAYLRQIPEFMSRCYVHHCDVTNEHDRSLIKAARSAYSATLDDAERHIAAVLRLAQHRRRPFRLIVTADHGELFGEHGAYAHGGGFVPELLAVPFAVYDSRHAEGREDCRLLTTAEAIEHAVGSGTEMQRGLEAREAITIEGPPLGRATINIAEGTIAYDIEKGFLRHRRTWRNLHDSEAGSVAFSPARCAPQK